MDASRMTPARQSSTFRALALLACLLLSRAADAQSVSIGAVAWLAGCWELRTPRALVREHWSGPEGGMMMGFSKTIVRDSVAEYEFVRIFAAGDTLVYEASPSGQQTAQFRAVRPFEPEIVFANPAHDFPQRVRYRRVGNDSLVARVEGIRNGTERGVDFRYARVSCP